MFYKVRQRETPKISKVPDEQGCLEGSWGWELKAAFAEHLIENGENSNYSALLRLRGNAGM